LAILHHDFWFWNDSRLVFGFLPVGMAYHVLFSIGAAALWLAALRWAWPEELEEWATGSPPTDGRSARR
jgi:hypothetical protein